jgi:hypothetical protein
LAENGAIEIGGALHPVVGPDAHAVAKEKNGFGLGVASAAPGFAATPCRGTGLLRRREIRQGKAGGSHGGEQYPVG